MLHFLTLWPIVYFGLRQPTVQRLQGWWANLVFMQTYKDMEEQNESRTDRRTQQGVESRVSNLKQ